MNKLIIILFTALFMFSCSSKLQRADDATFDAPLEGGLEYVEADVSDAETFATKDVTRSIKSDLLGEAFSEPTDRVLYFEFDSSSITSQNRAIIERHAAYFVTKPNIVITLEGHADERGSREYNLALGEQRANTVKRRLMLLGVASNQINTVSYGEEKPVVDGHNDAAWSKNRRVEVKY